MSLPRAKCVGGPLDGQWQCYYRDRPYVEMPIRQACGPVFIPELVEPVPTRIARYRREQLHTTEEIFTVLVHEDIPIGEALRLLLDHYNPPIGPMEVA